MSARIHKIVRLQWSRPQSTGHFETAPPGTLIALIAHLLSLHHPASRHISLRQMETDSLAVGIARTRLSDLEIVLMDEPTTAISVRQMAEELDMIRRPRESNHTRSAIDRNRGVHDILDPLAYKYTFVAEQTAKFAREIADLLEAHQTGERQASALHAIGFKKLPGQFTLPMPDTALPEPCSNHRTAEFRSFPADHR